MNSLLNPVLVLAAGDQVRWNHTHDEGIPAIKQLCEINRETLIQRIERQFPDAIVFTNNKELAKCCKRPYEVRDSLTTISTLASTCVHWRGWTTILLGDVMYSREMVKRLSRQKEHMMFYGDSSEIYCFKFHHSLREELAKLIQWLVSDPGWTEKYGKLWNLYRAMIGKDYTQHFIGDLFTMVGDCRDFDTKEEYLNYIK